MATKIYARIANGVVVELLETAGDITVMFHHDLRWIEATDVAGISCGWTYDGLRFAMPASFISQLPIQ